MSCFGPFKRNDLLVSISSHNFKTFDPGHHVFLTTRYLYAIAVDAKRLRMRYNKVFPEGQKQPWPKWQLETMEEVIKIPRQCWMDDEKTTAFIKLQGLAKEFGLDENE